MRKQTYFIHNAADMRQLGQQIGQQCQTGQIIFFHGPLGAGKTTLIKGMLYTLTGLPETAITSPTYTIVESYPHSNGQSMCHHFDLYRIHDPEELEWLGLRDYINDNDINLFEWPENGDDFLPTACHEIFIEYHDQGRFITHLYDDSDNSHGK